MAQINNQTMYDTSPDEVRPPRRNPDYGTPCKYTLSGKIVYGQGIGKLVGTPTANLQILSRDALPPVGVYVTEVLLEGQLYYGVTNR